ncbi:MAG: S8 family serine peptidase [Clostridiales bacterium]|nr:S8 family serine peptidase [Clostridiales bacterium]
MDYIDVIVKYNGSFSELLNRFSARGEDLSLGFGIIVIPYGRIADLARDEQVEYLELPRNLELMLSSASEGSCIEEVRGEDLNLTGRGVILGIIDSGFDFSHGDFLNDEGKTRFLYIWDLSSGEAVSGALYRGKVYDSEDINRYLKTGEGEPKPYDPLGHGTAIAGAMGGNGRESGGRYSGAAPEGSFIGVKLKSNKPVVTVDIMRGLKFIAEKAAEMNMPTVINISYGTNNGSHRGSSLFEQYIDRISETGRLVITAAAGNEGSSGHHFRGRVKTGEASEVKFNLASELGFVYLSLWKDFADKVSFELVLPNGSSTGVIGYEQTVFKQVIEGVNVSIDIGRPSPYSCRQEVFFFAGDFVNTLPSGEWTLKLYGNDVVDGDYDIWLPVSELAGSDTFFIGSDGDFTITLPATAERALSVGGYNSETGEIADLSGAGYNTDDVVKPDIAAPAAGIIAPRAGGGYDSFTGTSIASPIAAGAAALMMEWGIIRENDVFMYGQRLKAFFRLGALRAENRAYPNPKWGYGRLCLKNSIENALYYKNYNVDLYFTTLRGEHY